MSAAPITSLKDERLAVVRALDGREAREREGACVLEGATLVEQAARAGAPLRFAVHAEGETPLPGLLEAGVPVVPARASVLRQALRTQRPVAWLAVADLPPAADEFGDFAIVLDDVRDPGNLGTIARTALGLGVADLVCTSTEVDLTGRRVLDASRAAVLRARIHRYPGSRAAVEALRAAGFEVVATSSRAEHPQATVPLRSDRVALVVGNETDGVSDEALAAADHVVRIPMAGDVESLNVGVATGIGLHELRARAVAATLTDRARGALVTDLAAAVTALHRELDRGEGGVRPLDGEGFSGLLSVLAGHPVDSDVVARLAAEGLVGRAGPDDPSDDVVRATAAGRETAVALWTAARRAETTALAGFTASEREQLAAFLDRIRGNCGA